MLTIETATRPTPSGTPHRNASAQTRGPSPRSAGTSAKALTIDAGMSSRPMLNAVAIPATNRPDTSAARIAPRGRGTITSPAAPRVAITPAATTVITVARVGDRHAHAQLDQGDQGRGEQDDREPPPPAPARQARGARCRHRRILGRLALRHLDHDGPRLRRPPREADPAAVAEAQIEGACSGELAAHREPALLADPGDARRGVPPL